VSDSISHLESIDIGVEERLSLSDRDSKDILYPEILDNNSTQGGIPPTI
jgi:hypothetical protein